MSNGIFAMNIEYDISYESLDAIHNYILKTIHCGYNNKRHSILRNKYHQRIKCGNLFCNQNNKHNEWKKCARCKVIYYCSKKCQKYDWNKLKHRNICDMIIKLQ